MNEIGIRHLSPGITRSTVYRMPSMTPRRVEIVVAGVRWHIGPGGDEW